MGPASLPTRCTGTHRIVCTLCLQDSPWEPQREWRVVLRSCTAHLLRNCAPAHASGQALAGRPYKNAQFSHVELVGAESFRRIHSAFITSEMHATGRIHVCRALAGQYLPGLCAAFPQ